jgi:hypothetical protein
MSRGKGRKESAEPAPRLPAGTGATNHPAGLNATQQQTAGWMPQNTYYYPDPNSHASGAPPPSYSQGYPNPQGYPMSQHMQQGQTFSLPQPPRYPPPYIPVQTAAPQHQQHQQQRPPRSQRRSSGATPGLSPTNPTKLKFSDPSEARDRSEIPYLGDIFSDTQPLLQRNSNGDGYGSADRQPAVYNAPARSSNRPVRHKPTPVGLPRTNSAGDFNKRPSSPTPHADAPLRAGLRRARSGEDLMRMGRHHRQGSRSGALSAGNAKRPTHGRNDSMSSMRSNVSMGSVVSNISKSEFFGGVDGQGRVQMHFPFESVRLVMVDSEQPSLRRGHLYLDRGVDDYDQFEEYHRLTEGNNDVLVGPQWEYLDRLGPICDCNCNNCNGCIGKKNRLPAPSYMLAVDDNIYKSILGEISGARSMPCGIFFCGHHEDVSQPSIAIAAVLLTILFASLVYLAVFTGDMQLELGTR